MARSLSYGMVRGVKPAWLGCGCLSCPFPVCFSWLEGLELPVDLFLVGRLVTRTCWVAVRMSSSSIEYLLAHLSKLSMVDGGFLARDSKKGIPGQILLLKICRATRFYLKYNLSESLHKFSQ